MFEYANRSSNNLSYYDSLPLVHIMNDKTNATACIFGVGHDFIYFLSKFQIPCQLKTRLNAPKSVFRSDLCKCNEFAKITPVEKLFKNTTALPFFATVLVSITDQG